MIFTLEQAQQQINHLLLKYPDLVLFESNNSLIRLKGEILVHRVVKEFSLYKNYLIEICIPINSNELPYIIDTGQAIDSTYHHSYTSGKLCLETDSKIRIRFISGFNLVEWMDEFVEPYFVTYEYYKLYDEFPNGERQHGILGVMESYQDLLHAQDIVETYKIMLHIRNNVYRGHHFCPCESNLRLRSCHGKWIYPFYTDERIREIMLKDLQEFEKQLYETSRN